MKVVKRTADYTVYQKRSERYAVQNADKAWINGDDKAKILLDEGLIKVTPPKAPEPVADEAPAADDELSGEFKNGSSGREFRAPETPRPPLAMPQAIRATKRGCFRPRRRRRRSATCDSLL